MRKTINRLKYAINRENLVVTFNENTEYQVTRRSFRTTSEVETACQPGHLMVNNKCGELTLSWFCSSHSLFVVRNAGAVVDVVAQNVAEGAQNLKGTRCLGSVELPHEKCLELFVMKLIWLERCFKSRV